MIHREAWYREASYQEQLDYLWKRTDGWDPSHPEVTKFKESLGAARKFFDLLVELDPGRSEAMTSGMVGTLSTLENQADQLDKLTRKDLW